MSPCDNVLLTMRNAVLFKTVILELMQSMCAVDGQLITKACKTIQIFPKQSLLLNFDYPHPTFLNFDRLAHIVPHLATASYFSC